MDPRGRAPGDYAEVAPSAQEVPGRAPPLLASQSALQPKGTMDLPQVHPVRLSSLPQDGDVVERARDAPLAPPIEVPDLAEAVPRPLGDGHVRVELLGVMALPRHPRQRAKSTDQRVQGGLRGG